MNRKFTLGFVTGASVAGFMVSGLMAEDGQPSPQTPAVQPEKENKLSLSPKDYTFGYWQNGMRKHKGNVSKDILCIESGYYGLSLDVAALNKPRFGLFKDSLDYNEALAASDSRMRELGDASLDIELEKDGKVYRAVSAKAAKERLTENRMLTARLWESARYVQHFDFHGLEFVDDKGEKLVTNASLDVVAWPESLTINAELEPIVALNDGPQKGVRGKGQGVKDGSHLIAHQPELEHEQFTLETWINVPEEYLHKNRGWIVSKNGNEGTEGYYGLAISGDSVSGVLNIGGGGRGNYYQVKTGRHTLQPGKWYHLAMTYDGKSLVIYVNGRQQASTEVNKKRILGNGAMRIGRRSNNAGRSAKIIVDQVRIWNKPLAGNQLIRHTRNPADLGKRDGLTYINDFEAGGELKLPVWNNAKLRIRLKGGKHQWQTEQVVPGAWAVGQKKKITLNCDLGEKHPTAAKISVAMKHNKAIAVSYRPEAGCYAAKINGPKRKGKRGYADIRDYDEMNITIDAKKKGKVPFLMEIFNPANITGACPILCDESGRPTGIPVQLGKNWHHMGMGSYIRLYALLPADQGQKKYTLKIAYGFYGSLPAASHAQLSLVGYGGHGRWDQLAIGCWGETYCMDMDMSCTDVAITDVRMLMARNGANGNMWGWTDAGWGGDWLGLQDSKNQKHLFNGVKTAYLAHGPCLTDVKYNGAYGAQREIDFNATVRTLRTDDYARTFTTLDYTFDQKVNATGWLFKMGRTGGYITPKIAYGNIDGLIKEHAVPDGLKRGQPFLERTTLTGKGPWWVSFPEAYHTNSRDTERGSGYRAMVIRSYKAVIGGKEYLNPAVEFPVYHTDSQRKVGLDFLLTAPLGVTQFNPGDRVEIDVEWITLPRVADDYYGPNETFRKHVAANPSSWKTTYREAKGNDLKVSVEGGSLKKHYPVIVQADKPVVKVTIDGGVGYVPIRFEGLKKANGYALYQLVNGAEKKLDQSVHGNDFWQTDYDAKSDSFKITYNLPLNDLPQSTWILRPLKPEAAVIIKQAPEAAQ